MRRFKLISLLLLIVSCKNQSDNSVEEKEGDTILIKSFDSIEKLTFISEARRDSVLNGKTTIHDSVGNIIEEQMFSNGKRNGIFAFYYSSGKKHEETFYQNNQLIWYKQYN